MFLAKTQPDIQIIVKGREFINMSNGRVEIVERDDMEQITPTVLELVAQASKQVRIKLMHRKREIERVLGHEKGR
jgi:hypothetical protein